MIPWRYSLLVLPLVCVPLGRYSLQHVRLRALPLFTGLVVIACLLTTLNRSGQGIHRYLYPKDENVRYAAFVERYDPLFAKLREQTGGPTVALAPFQLSHYVPVYTQDYVEFARPARFHPVSSQELLERMLVMYVDTADRSFIASAEQVNAYAGVGIVNTLVALHDCAAMPFCNPGPIPQREVDMIGGEAFLDTAEQLLHTIDQQYETYLNKYHVRFIVHDAKESLNPRIPKDAKAIWSSGDFVLYERSVAL